MVCENASGEDDRVVPAGFLNGTWHGIGQTFLALVVVDG